MASTGKKGKKNKGKTVPLTDFLSSNSLSWSDQVDEADKLGEFSRKHALPAAPRAARAPDIDESRIPKNPPYVAYLSNLSYELEEDDIINAFEDLSILTIRLPRDEHSGRLKGFGYVEFADRGSFILALHKYIATIRGRRIKIDVAENEVERRRGGPRDNRDRDSNYDPERTSGDWRSGPRSEFAGSDDRRGGRRDYGGFRERDGYDKGRSGNFESSWRDNERRFNSDRDGRSSYGSRRNYDEPDNNNSEPKTRKKLILQPRKAPLEDVVVKEDPDSKKDEERSEPEKPSAASIFGQARPVDTAAREREIEQRLEKEKEGAKIEKDLVKPRGDSERDLSSDGKRPGPISEPKENVWVRRSQRPEAQSVTSRELPSDKTSDSDEPLPNNENDGDRDGDINKDEDRDRDRDEDGGEEKEKEVPENSEDSSEPATGKRNDEHDESDHDADSRYNSKSRQYNKSDNRYNERNRDSDRGYRRDDRWRDDRDRKDRDRRDDRRDRGYDNDRRGRDQERDGDSKRYSDRDGDSRRYSDRDGDSKRYSDRDGDSKRYNERDSDSKRYSDRDGDSKRYSDRDGDSKRYSDRDGDSKRYSDRDGDSKRYGDRDGDSKRYSDRDGDSKRYSDRDGDSKRYSDRDGDYKKSSSEKDGDWRKYSEKDGDNKRFQEGRYRDQEDHGSNKGPRDRRTGPSSGDRGSRQARGTQERERGPQYKDRPRDQKKPEEGLRMPKYKEAAAPNYIGTNKYSFLEEGGVSE